MRWKEDGPLFSMHPRTLTTEQYSQSCDEKPQHTGSTIMKWGDKANFCATRYGNQWSGSYDKTCDINHDRIAEKFSIWKKYVTFQTFSEMSQIFRNVDLKFSEMSQRKHTRGFLINIHSLAMLTTKNLSKSITCSSQSMIFLAKTWFSLSELT